MKGKYNLKFAHLFQTMECVNRRSGLTASYIFDSFQVQKRIPPNKNKVSLIITRTATQAVGTQH